MVVRRKEWVLQESPGCGAALRGMMEMPQSLSPWPRNSLLRFLKVAVGPEQTSLGSIYSELHMKTAGWSPPAPGAAV